MASAVIFLFTNLASPMMAQAPTVDETAPAVTQQQFTEVASHVQIQAPRVVTILPQEHACIRVVTIPPFLGEDLAMQVFHYQNNTKIAAQGYGNEVGAYVNVAPTDMQTGLVQIQTCENTLQKNLQELLGSPDRLSVRSEMVCPFLGPRIITDQKTSSHYLLFEPFDFRFAEKPIYHKKALEQTLVSIYGAFQGYSKIVKNAIVHTGFWGKAYHHNEHVTTALQLLAGSLCHVQLIFHVGSSTQPFDEAVSFIHEQNGVSVHDFLDRLLYKTVDPSWQATG